MAEDLETPVEAAGSAVEPKPDAKRRAIVLIPGFRREERFFRRDILVRNLLMVERSPLREGGDIEVTGEQGKRLIPRTLRGDTMVESTAVAEVDIFEAFWADMIPDTIERTPWQKLLWGLELIVYWVLNWRSWTAFRTSRYMTFGLLAGGTLLVLWYISIILLAAQAIGQNPPEFLEQIPQLKPVIDGFVTVASAIGTWQLWIIVAAVLPMMRIDELVHMAGFIKDYFQNKPDETEVGLRQRLRNRVQSTLENVYQAGYEEVTILAHSFGTILAIDLMADWPHGRDLARTTLVTMGSPVAVLAHRSPWLSSEVDRLAARDDIAAWDDYYAATDWLCTAIPGRDKFAGAGGSHLIDFETRLTEMMTGRTHLLYYRHSHLLEQLVQARPALSSPNPV